ncbi:hypothetical protein AB0L06_37270 [Spirillospora sp. NPDC052269]
MDRIPWGLGRWSWRPAQPMPASNAPFGSAPMEAAMRHAELAMGIATALTLAMTALAGPARPAHAHTHAGAGGGCSSLNLPGGTGRTCIRTTRTAIVVTASASGPAVDGMELCVALGDLPSSCDQVVGKAWSVSVSVPIASGVHVANAAFTRSGIMRTLTSPVLTV